MSRWGSRRYRFPPGELLGAAWEAATRARATHDPSSGPLESWQKQKARWAIASYARGGDEWRYRSHPIPLGMLAGRIPKKEFPPSLDSRDTLRAHRRLVRLSCETGRLEGICQVPECPRPVAESRSNRPCLYCSKACKRRWERHPANEKARQCRADKAPGRRAAIGEDRDAERSSDQQHTTGGDTAISYAESPEYPLSILTRVTAAVNIRT